MPYVLVDTYRGIRKAQRIDLAGIVERSSALLVTAPHEERGYRDDLLTPVRSTTGVLAEDRRKRVEDPLAIA